MEIKHNTEKTSTFGKVKCGGCFYAIGAEADRLFMRLDETYEDGNAVSLSDGGMETFGGNCKVYLVEAFVTVTAIR